MTFGRFVRPHIITVTLPIITGLSLNLGDPLGGTTNIITGTGFTGATAVTNTSSFIVDSSTQITATMAAHAAGMQTITVTTPLGTSNAVSYEYWEPSVVSPSWFGDTVQADGVTPGYALGVNGEWQGRHTSVPAGSGVSINAARAPTDAGGYPNFHRANSQWLANSTIALSNVGTWGAGDRTALVVLDIGVIEPQGTHGVHAGSPIADNPAIVSDPQSYCAMALGGPGADEALFWVYGTSYQIARVTLSSAAGYAVLAGRQIIGSNLIQITQDGSTWNSAPGGAAPGSTAGSIYVGTGQWYGAGQEIYYDGKIQAMVLDNKAWTDADVAKFYKWAAGRHPPLPFPISENLTSWLKAPSGTTPWINASSDGISAQQQDATNAISPILNTISGVTGLQYGAGGSGSGTILKTTISGTSDIATYLSPSRYTVLGLVYVASTQAFQPSTPYQNTTVLCGDARWGITLSTSGLGVWHYNGSFPSVNVSMSTGAWHFFCIRYDNVSGNVQLDIDNVAGTPTPIAAFAAFAGITTFTAKNSYTNVTTDFTIAERMTYAFKISDSKRDQWYAYMKSTYPTAGLP